MTLDERIERIRQFNRFYTRQIGVLQEGLLKSPFSLTEVRVLYELAHLSPCTASDLIAALGLDASYLSRILTGFESKGLLTRSPSPTDARQNLLCLTGPGRETFAPLNALAQNEIRDLLSPLSDRAQDRLVQSMETIQRLLSPDRETAPVTLREDRPGDFGWIVERHGAIYFAECGWGNPFEALVAQVVADFLKNRDMARERCWIAERQGERLGSIMLVKQSEEVAKLRLLLVEPSARGLGIGQRLVAECIAFAQTAGYRKIQLWTQDDLVSARRIYQAAGFRLVSEEKHTLFGPEVNGQVWERDL